MHSGASSGLSAGKRPEFDPGTVLVRDADAPPGMAWTWFDDPVEIIEAREVEEVVDALRRVEEAATRGLYGAGYLAYEAAPAFDGALRVKDGSPLPLLWFGIYVGARRGEPPGFPARAEGPAWQPSLDASRYMEAVRHIKAYIAAGDTYQVNFTMRLQRALRGDPRGLFAGMLQRQPDGYAAYIDAGDHVVCSVSPELFFALDGEAIVSRPMKGTAPRGHTLAEDHEQAEALHRSEKDQAENVMIVDMVRNDLGRIAKPGSVTVDSLFDIERHETLFQMTSTVRGRTRASLPGIFRALFPCASVTGAPKVRAMQIIAELEDSPRGVYTGCTGVVSPGRRAQFSVAIRTVHIDRAREQAAYGTGSGIVWDSVAEAEYRECATKALVLQPAGAGFHLLETLRWEPEEGFYFLEHHLRRLGDSAAYFGFALEPGRAGQELRTVVLSLPARPHRVRLLAGRGGEIHIEATAMDAPFRAAPGPANHTFRVCLADTPISLDDPFLYHKTTRREVYDFHRRAHPGVDDVVLWNEAYEVTETTVGNVVVETAGRYWTPPTAGGLLGGSYRAALLEEGRLRERPVRRDELTEFDALYMINSIRGWVRLDLLGVSPRINS